MYDDINYWFRLILWCKNKYLNCSTNQLTHFIQEVPFLIFNSSGSHLFNSFSICIEFPDPTLSSPVTISTSWSTSIWYLFPNLVSIYHIWSQINLFGPNLPYLFPIWTSGPNLPYLVPFFPALSVPYFHYLFPVFTIWFLFSLSDSYFHYLIPISTIWFLFPLSDSYFHYLIPISTIWSQLFPTSG